MFSVAADMLWVYTVQCKRNKITRILPRLLTAVLGITKKTHEHLLSIN